MSRNKDVYLPNSYEGVPISKINQALTCGTCMCRFKTEFGIGTVLQLGYRFSHCHVVYILLIELNEKRTILGLMGCDENQGL